MRHIIGEGRWYGHICVVKRGKTKPRRFLACRIVKACVGARVTGKERLLTKDCADIADDA